jgi:winged helix-turn-helix protein
VLEAGPAVWGWDEDQCWTLARIAEVIRGRFRADYTLAGVDLLLHWIGWSVQVPARRATERDEAAIARWKQVSWPQIKAPGPGPSPSSPGSAAAPRPETRSPNRPRTLRSSGGRR